MELSLYNQFFLSSVNEKTKKELEDLNKESVKYGLILSEKDIDVLVKADREAAESQERFTFDVSAVAKLTKKFMKSSYISQMNFTEVICELTDIFYEAREECSDRISDDDVIKYMFEKFEKEAGGDTELLASKYMEGLCKKMRSE